MKIPALILALTVALPSAAFAAGINLAWGNCVGAGGLQNQLFACNTNSAAEAHLLVCSFRAPAGITRYVSNQAVIELLSADAVLPAWWQLKGTGQCRTGSAIGDANFVSGPFGCTDLWMGSAVGSLASYNVGFGDVNRGRMSLVFAVPASAAAALNPEQEYYAFKVQLLNTKTTGAGSCAGCPSPMCIQCTQLIVIQPNGWPGGNVSLTSPAENSYITWNAGAPNYGVSSPGLQEIITEPPQRCAYDPVPTRRTTWGMIKGLYR